MGDRKRGDAAFLILKYLGDNGPAIYEKISNDLGIPQSTVENRVREILIKRHGLVRKLPSDKLALKWYTDEEETANTLKRKLLRNPQPEELACILKTQPTDASDVLVKYIPSYREPTDEEITSSSQILWKTILSRLELPSKKDLFEKGVLKAVFEGVDRETLNSILKNELSPFKDEGGSYLEEFPEMKPKLTIQEKNRQIVYRIDWSDESKKVLSKTDSWKQTTEIRIPRRCEETMYLGGSDSWEMVEMAQNLAEIYAPNQHIINQLLELIGLPHYENNVLIVLKKFCQTALEVDLLDEGTKRDDCIEAARCCFYHGYT
jgi:hypothetical protein